MQYFNSASFDLFMQELREEELKKVETTNNIFQYYYFKLDKNEDLKLINWLSKVDDISDYIEELVHKDMYSDKHAFRLCFTLILTAFDLMFYKFRKIYEKPYIKREDGYEYYRLTIKLQDNYLMYSWLKCIPNKQKYFESLVNKDYDNMLKLFEKYLRWVVKKNRENTYTSKGNDR